jgi:FkbM family methyltransferase
MADKFSLAEIVPDIPEINIVDVGAMSLGPGSEPYAPLVDANRARVVGFEPNPEECEKLRGIFGERHAFHPHFIGDGGEATFYETNLPTTGSLYRPNRHLIEKFQNLYELMTVKETHKVQTHRLDDVAGLEDTDFLKIDIQGAELAALKGATKVLAGATLVQAEVEFLELYEGQPLFGDVDALLRGAGFQFHTFMGFGTRCFKPLLVNNKPSAGMRQYLWSDAVYVRDFLKLNDVPNDKLLRLALMLHDLLGSCDLCHYVLMELDRRSGGALAPSYIQRLIHGAAT